MYVCLWLAPERLDKSYLYSVFKSFSVIGQCPVNMNILVPKIESLQMGPRNKMATFSKKAPNISNQFQELMQTVTLN
jgi:hypothetical protein